MRAGADLRAPWAKGNFQRTAADVGVAAYGGDDAQAYYWDRSPRIISLTATHVSENTQQRSELLPRCVHDTHPVLLFILLFLSTSTTGVGCCRWFTPRPLDPPHIIPFKSLKSHAIISFAVGVGQRAGRSALGPRRSGSTNSTQAQKLIHCQYRARTIHHQK